MHANRSERERQDKSIVDLNDVNNVPSFIIKPYHLIVNISIVNNMTIKHVETVLVATPSHTPAKPITWITYVFGHVMPLHNWIFHIHTNTNTYLWTIVEWVMFNISSWQFWFWCKCHGATRMNKNFGEHIECGSREKGCRQGRVEIDPRGERIRSFIHISSSVPEFKKHNDKRVYVL